MGEWMKRGMAAAALVTTVATVAPAMAATNDMFLKISGIKGESRDAKHAGDIDVLSWSWGVSNPGSSHLGGGIGAGKANFAEIHVVKHVDMSSPKLFELTATGAHVPQIELFVRKAGASQAEFVHITMKNVVVTSISLSANASADIPPSESVTFSYDEVTYEYMPQLPDGRPGGGVKFSYNVRANLKM